MHSDISQRALLFSPVYFSFGVLEDVNARAIVHRVAVIATTERPGVTNPAQCL